MAGGTVARTGGKPSNDITRTPQPLLMGAAATAVQVLGFAGVTGLGASVGEALLRRPQSQNRLRRSSASPGNETMPTREKSSKQT
jgi:hypothetical protein